MKKQVIVIHGGSAFNSYKEYIDDLKQSTYEPDWSMFKGWKDHLPKDLGKEYEVFQPEMPNWWNATYFEWKIFFEKVLARVHDNAIFIGHSLGGIFLAKYFSENKYKKKLKAIILISPPYKDKKTKKDELIGDFVLGDLKLLNSYGDRLHLYHSKDDQMVSFSNQKKYVVDLPNAKVFIFKDRGHFTQSKFPEIVKDIRSF